MVVDMETCLGRCFTELGHDVLCVNITIRGKGFGLVLILLDLGFFFGFFN